MRGWFGYPSEDLSVFLSSIREDHLCLLWVDLLVFYEEVLFCNEGTFCSSLRGFLIVHTSNFWADILDFFERIFWTSLEHPFKSHFCFLWQDVLVFLWRIFGETFVPSMSRPFNSIRRVPFFFLTMIIWISLEGICVFYERTDWSYLRRPFGLSIENLFVGHKRVFERTTFAFYEWIFWSFMRTSYFSMSGPFRLPSEALLIFL